MSAQIRLGHKYEVDGLVQPNLDYLRYYYPDTFEGWWKEPRGGPPDFKPHCVIGIVNLARLTGASTILRIALMKCALLDVDMIMNGFVREDGLRETLYRSLPVRKERGRPGDCFCAAQGVRATTREQLRAREAMSADTAEDAGRRHAARRAARQVPMVGELAGLR